MYRHKLKPCSINTFNIHTTLNQQQQVGKLMNFIRKLLSNIFLYRVKAGLWVSAQSTFLYLNKESAHFAFPIKFCDCLHFPHFPYMVTLNYLFMKNEEGNVLSNCHKKSLWKHQSYCHEYPIIPSNLFLQDCEIMYFSDYI